MQATNGGKNVNVWLVSTVDTDKYRYMLGYTCKYRYITTLCNSLVRTKHSLGSKLVGLPVPVTVL